MTIHSEFRAAIIKAAKAAKPGLTDTELEAIVARVASSSTFAQVADFLSDDLRAVAFSDFDSIVRVFALSHVTAAATAPDARQDIPPDVWARMTPQQKLGRHYQAEAGERPDIEGPGLAARIAEGRATPLDKLQQRPVPPTKEERRAADNPKVNTADLSTIVDPNKRHAAYRGRVADTRAVERLRLDQTAYTKKALDPNTPPNIRAQANLELGRIAERLKALNA